MDGRLYLLFVTALLLFALALTLPVIRDIVLEGLGRHQQRNIERAESDGETERRHDGRAADGTDAAGRRCPHCGARNDRERTVCQECSEQL